MKLLWNEIQEIIENIDDLLTEIDEGNIKNVRIKLIEWKKELQEFLESEN